MIVQLCDTTFDFPYCPLLSICFVKYEKSRPLQINRLTIFILFLDQKKKARKRYRFQFEIIKERYKKFKDRSNQHQIITRSIRCIIKYTRRRLFLQQLILLFWQNSFLTLVYPFNSLRFITIVVLTFIFLFFSSTARCSFNNILYNVYRYIYTCLARPIYV